MTARGIFSLMTGLTLTAIALSTGSQICALIGVMALLSFLLMLLTILIAFATLRLSQSLTQPEVLRQSKCQLRAVFRYFSIMPLPPFTLNVQTPSGREQVYTLSVRPFRRIRSDNEFACPHVGAFSVGVAQIELQDPFCLFHLKKTIHSRLPQILVLPQPASVSPVPVRLSSEDGPSAAYASSDHNTPEGIRGWMQGDELRRIHWKLSAKRQTLLVRTYEQNQRPDTLILLNSAFPETLEGSRFPVIDALTESCAGAIANLLSESRPVCMPILERNTEFRATSMTSFPDLQRTLSALNYSAEDRFAEFLELSSPRLQRSDTVLIFSPSITPDITDSVIHLSQFGSAIRFTLATVRDLSSQELKLLQMLISENIEAFQVSIS